MSVTRAALASGVALVLAAGCDGSASVAAKEPADPPWFEEVAAARGLVFRHVSGHEKEFWMPEIMSGGGALLDADGDGDLDVYLVQGGSLRAEDSGPATNQLFENTGAAHFRDVSAASGAALHGYGMGAAVGDADQDGDPDLYVTRVGPNALLENQGGLRFADVTARAAVGHPGWGTSAGFFDADRDGDLDLFVVNYVEWSLTGELPCLNTLSQPDYCSPKNYRTPARSVFYVNGGQGVFTDASASSGVASARGNGLGIAIGDLDEDGWLDVFVANDGTANHLWHNEGGDRFKEIAMERGCGVDTSGQEKAGMGVVLADLDQDLDLDLVVCNLAGELDSVYRNDKGLFVDRTAVSGVGTVSKPFTRFGLGCLDFDADGRLDLFEAAGRVQSATEPRGADVYAEENLLFRGQDGGRFAEQKPRGGVRSPLAATSRAALFGDLDGDGALDVVLVNRDGPAHLLHNVASPHGHWILFDVREKTGASALGARLDLTLAGRKLRRDVMSAYSYLSANDPRVHLGLGDAREVEAIDVTWVDGKRESFGTRAADQVHVLRRGAGKALE